jgi:DNA-binding NtrC family response regulator
MSQRRRDPRLFIVATAGELRDRLTTFFADLAPVAVSPAAPDVLEIPARTPSLHVALVVETGGNGALDLLRAAKARHPHLAVFVLSATPTVDHATAAVRSGAEDFVPIPFAEEVLRKEVDRALEAAAMREDLAQLRTLVSTTCGFDQIVSGSARMRAVFDRAQAAARSETPVLIVGETGTGKELLARAIHAGSRRRDRPFVPVNCAALPHDLVESELFGHRRGAFSGAHADHPGLFAAAHRGTLMLDEVGELPLETQAKLLRVLQDGEVRPVGALESRRVDVRMIAATNRSVRELRSGALRQDLFFRLSVLVIQVPPLRERPEDIPCLIDHFVARYREAGAARCRPAADALDVLARYHFPGNVRELKNLVENLCATLPPDRADISSDEVRAWFRRQGTTIFPAPPRNGQDSLPLDLASLEVWAIRAALARSGGNKSRAAQILGISRDSLYRKLHEMGDLPSDSLTLAPSIRKHGS